MRLSMRPRCFYVAKPCGSPEESIKKSIGLLILIRILQMLRLASRTGVEPRLVGVAAVKGKRPIVIQGNLAAWIALYRTSRSHGNAYWTFNGPLLALGERR
jgi:hypothetical protein